MIELSHKEDCCGCSACVQICPKHCIEMKEDFEGFLYPLVDSNSCVECHLCEKVCPVLNQNDSIRPLKVCATKNPDEQIRMKSSSGGVFSILAESVIAAGGVVFGAGFNEHWAVVHSYTETKEGLSAFRMSKYLQSVVGNTYKEVQAFLKQGRLVLYTGTPCQIAGLKLFLRKEYDNLLTVDFICHGVPSPGVFRWYLTEEIYKLSSDKKYEQLSLSSIPEVDASLENTGYKITNIRFRDKSTGWKNYSFAMEFTADDLHNKVVLSYPHNENAFIKGFLNDLYLRPSCHSCPAKNMKSGSDMTIGDFWGMERYPGMSDDDRGTSIILLNTDKGEKFYSKVDLSATTIDFDFVCKYNSALVKSAVCTEKREQFFSDNGESFSEKIDELCRIPSVSSVRHKVGNALRKIKNLLIK